MYFPPPKAANLASFEVAAHLTPAPVHRLGTMPKDRDQQTPDDPADRGALRPHRSAAREAEEPLDHSTGPGPASRGGDPRAVDELPPSEAEDYK
jgi:hypothetical protein